MLGSPTGAPGMSDNTSSYIRRCITLMLEPVVEFCLSRGLRMQDFNEIAKGCFVRIAERSLEREGREVSVSKICIMTGIQRPEIGRLRDAAQPPKSKDFITRLIGQWSGDRTFQDKRGRPKALTTSGARSEFAKLVAAVSKDLNPHTVRFEMERTGVVVHEKGLARLVQPAHITSGDPQGTLKFLGEDSRDLLVSIQENAFSKHYIPNLHARTYYDNIPDEEVPVIKGWLLAMGSRIHEECRNFLSRFDRDISPGDKSLTGRNRIILTTFSRVETLDEKSASSKEAD